MGTHWQLYNFIKNRWVHMGQRRLLKQATLAAYTRWAQSHPAWVVAFFDEHFVTQHVVPFLMDAIESQCPLDPQAVAAQWADQFHFPMPRRRTLIMNLVPAVTEFFSLFRAELNNQPADHPHWLRLWQAIDQPCADCNQ